MSTTRNVKAQSRARYLLAVLVALAFAMCLAVPAAFAETGTITIKSQEGNAAASYDAYQIFAADIAANGEATDIQWAGADDAAKNAMKAAVEGAIKAHAGKWTAEDEAADATHVAGADKYTGTTAQDAADYISANIEGDTLTDPAQGESVYTLPNGTRVAADSFANLLAAAVDDTTKAATVAAGQVATLDEGYWLFVNTPEDPSGTVTQDKVGTSPIYQVINREKPLEITPKMSVPTVQKQVKEDGTITKYELDQSAGTYVKKRNADEYVLGTNAPTFGSAGSDEYEYNATDDGYAHYKAVETTKWDIVADANKDQAMPYRIIGTLPDNYVTFDHYFYKFTDVLSAGLDLVTAGNTFAESDVTVRYYSSMDVVEADLEGTGGTVIDAANYVAAYDATNRTLTVTFDPALNDDGSAVAEPGALTGTDLKKVTGINKDSVIVVYYNSKLNGNAIIAGEGNPNTVNIEYSNNPNTEDHGKTEDKENKLYTFELEIEKVRKGAEDTKLAGAYFVITVAEPAKDGNVGKYVKADGSLAEVPEGFDPANESSWFENGAVKDAYTDFVFVTGTDGKFTAPRIDAGTYAVKEIKAPEGYNKIAADVTVTIGATYGDPDGKTLASLSAEASGGNGDGVDEKKGAAQDQDYADADDPRDGIVETGTGLKAVDANANGSVDVRVTNEQRITMPLTGMDGITFTYILGGIILAVSVFALLRRKMSNRVQEDVA